VLLRAHDDTQKLARKAGVKLSGVSTALSKARGDAEAPEPTSPPKRKRGTAELLSRAPKCKAHGLVCKLHTAGPNAMPHNVGRRFWRCPRQSSQVGGCDTWMWEDGSLPFSDESQERFDEWADDSGFAGLPFGCQLARIFGAGCGED